MVRRLQQLIILVIVSSLILGINSVIIVQATVVKDTAAGEVTWDDRSTELNEVSLETSSGSYNDGYDGAMIISLSGSVSQTMEYHFSDTYGMVIQEIAITNSGGSSTTYTIRSYGNIGSDSNTKWHYVDNIGPYYTISSDQSDASINGTDPVLSFLYGDDSINDLGTSQSIDMSNTNYHDFEIQNVDIDAGETQRYLFLGGVGDIDDDQYNRPDKSYIAVLDLVDAGNWPDDFTSFLSGSEMVEIVNWDNISDYIFTNCGQTGRTGPSQTQVNNAYSGTSLDGDVTINTQGIQEWTVPTTGTYRITVAGAKGGDGSVSNGGNGAVMIGDFTLTHGDELKILVGQMGQTESDDGSGGGGTFVVESDNTPLIIAGGGGGGSHSQSFSADQHGDTHENGNPGVDGAYGGSNGGGGGGYGHYPTDPQDTNCSGECTAESGSYAAGGGGLLGEGGDANSGAEGGYAFIDGGEGGRDLDGNGADGGFGGGGGHADGNYGGSGGGGYSGGGAGDSSSDAGGGGGGSFNDGFNQENTAGENSGHGYVTMEILSEPSPPVPEATTMMLFVSGFIFLALIAFNKRKK